MTKEAMIKEVIDNVMVITEKDGKFNALLWRAYDHSVSSSVKSARDFLSFTFNDWKEVYVEGFVKNNIANVNLDDSGHAVLEMRNGETDTTFYVNLQNVKEESNLVFERFKDCCEAKFSVYK